MSRRDSLYKDNQGDVRSIIIIIIYFQCNVTLIFHLCVSHENQLKVILIFIDFFGQGVDLAEDQFE